MVDPSLRDEPTEAEVIASDLVLDGMVWKVRRDRFRYNGDEISREFVEHPGAAAIVAIDDRERVLLIQQYRHPIRHRDWEIPAGLLDEAGETPLARLPPSVASSVRRPTGAAEWEPLVSIFTTPGGNDEVVHIFLARGLSIIEEGLAAPGGGGSGHPHRMGATHGCRGRRHGAAPARTASSRSVASPPRRSSGGTESAERTGCGSSARWTPTCVISR